MLSVSGGTDSLIDGSLKQSLFVKPEDADTWTCAVQGGSPSHEAFLSQG